MFLLLACGCWAAPCRASSPALAAARVTINSNSGSLSSSSTNSTGAFQIANESSGGLRITSVKIDVSTALLPDVVFDPAGTAGDPDGKAFQLDSFTGSGAPVHGFESPRDGIGSGDGYEVLVITCGPGVDFGPGDSMTFSADIDPTSVKGAAGPGPEHAASISGLELIGATVSVGFSDDTLRVVRTGGLPGSSGNKASMALLAPDNLPTPTISVPGRTSPFTISQQPLLRIAGPAGATVALGKFPAALYLAGVPGGGYDIDPYEVNKVIGFGFDQYAIGAGGFVDVPLNLSWSAGTGGIHLLSAWLVDGSGRRGSSSDVLVVDYNPTAGSGDDEAPTMPANLAVSAVTAGGVTLVWDASSDDTAVEGYKIYRNGGWIATTVQPGFSDSGLQPLTRYSYEVEAIDAAGNGSTRTEVTAITAAASPDTSAPTMPGALAAVAGQSRVMLSWSASSDNIGVTGYRIRRDGNEVARVLATGFTDVGLGSGIVYQYEVTALDAAGNVSPAATVQATPLAGLAAPLRVKAGSPNGWVDPDGDSWLPDFGYSTGSYNSYSTAILGTSRPLLYQSRRSVGSSQPLLGYQFTMPDGAYQVRLHFVEVVPSLFAAGARVFDIVAEGAVVVDDLDIFARVGANTACVLSFPVTVSDGQLNLTFPKSANNPTICGIEVLPAPPQVPTFGEWLAAFGLAGKEAEDSDFGGLANLAEYQLDLDPNDRSDDAVFRLRYEVVPGGLRLTLPPLKPLGDYHLHRGDDLVGLAGPARRIATVSRQQILAMSPAAREAFTVTDTAGGTRAFYQLIFEPSAD